MATLKTPWIYAMAFLLILALAPQAFAQTREKVPVGEALAAAAAEKAKVERAYRANQDAERKKAERTEYRTISVELGDGMAPEDRELADRVKFKGSDRSYREKEASAKLEREWKEVNKAMKRTLVEKSQQEDQKL